jgi:hypothetical protein
MTTTEVRTTALPTGVSRTGAALLIVAPLLMALGRVLLVPFEDDDWNAVLTDMAAHRGRSDAGWLLALAASGLLAITAAILAAQLRTRRQKSAVFALVTTALGWAGTAAICGGAHLMSAMAKATDRDAQVQIIKEFNDGTATGMVFLVSVIAAVGYVVLAVGLARAQVTSKGAAVLIGLGGVTTLLTMAGPLTPLLVATALLLAAGHGLALRTLGRP